MTEKQGLYDKYIITKTDGSPVDPHAQYFVLRIDTDPCARLALDHSAQYLERYEVGSPQLEDEIYQWLRATPLKLKETP